MAKITEQTCYEIFDWLNENDAKLAKAKALVHVWEKGERSKRSDLMRTSNMTSVSAREEFAYGHDDYKAYVKTTSDMIEQYETLKLQRETKLAQLDIFRTLESSKRAMTDKFR